MQARKKNLSAKRAALLVVDMQDAFVPHIAGMAEVTSRCAIMIQAAKLLDLPVIVTEQYPKGIRPDHRFAAKSVGAILLITIR